MALPTIGAVPQVTLYNLTSEQLTKEVSVATMLSAIEKAAKKKKKAKAAVTKKKIALLNDLNDGGVFRKELSEEDEKLLKRAFNGKGYGVVTSNCNCDICKGIVGIYNQWKKGAEAKVILAESKAQEPDVGNVHGSLYNIPWRAIRTQKAKGIKACQNILASTWAPGLSDLNQLEKSIYLYPHNPAPKDGVWFARPCPVTPKHGFVESRSINAISVKKVYKEVLEHDPQGELILMEPLSGLFSGVATESAVAFGNGNDGVTGAGNGVVSIPVSFQRLAIPKSLLGTGLILRHAYIEMVEHRGKMFIVQLRDGPKPPPAVADYVPHSMQVELILTPLSVGDDLLKWEEHIKRAIELNGNSTDGIVVHLPKGSLASHWAVHAITHKIAVVTSTSLISRGMTIHPSASTPALTNVDYEHLAERIQRWTERDYVAGSVEGTYCKGVIGSAVAAIQSQHLWGDDNHLIDLRAAAVVSLIRFLSAACVGEVRYYMRNGPGSKRDVPQRTILRGEGGFSQFGRSSIYSIYLRPIELTVLEDTMHDVFGDFMEPGWRNAEDKIRFDREGEVKGSQNYGYGGPRWGNSAAVTEVLIRKTRQFIKNPSEEKWAALIKQANVAVNTAHNNGQVLSKWLSSNFFNNVTMMPGGGFMNAFTARVCLGHQMQGVDCEAPNDE